MHSGIDTLWDSIHPEVTISDAVYLSDYLEVMCVQIVLRFRVPTLPC